MRAFFVAMLAGDIATILRSPRIIRKHTASCPPARPTSPGGASRHHSVRVPERWGAAPGLRARNSLHDRLVHPAPARSPPCHRPASPWDGARSWKKGMSLRQRRMLGQWWRLVSSERLGRVSGYWRIAPHRNRTGAVSTITVSSFLRAPLQAHPQAGRQEHAQSYPQAHGRSSPPELLPPPSKSLLQGALPDAFRTPLTGL